jgi:hypothetical protein
MGQNAIGPKHGHKEIAMRLNKTMMLSIVALPFCAALIGCAATTGQSESVATVEQSEWVVAQPATRPAPVVKAPVYKNGDWWKVKFERKRSGQGLSCLSYYSDYLLKIQEGKPKLYGINGTNKEEFDCAEVEDGILGKIKRKLKFPLRVGDSWNHKFLRFGINTGRRIMVEYEYKVLGWERLQTPRGMFEAFKLSSFGAYISVGHLHELIGTYYYAPKVKAIILYRHIFLHPPTITRDRTVTVVDFNVSN